tara:strand:+ start:355 stop:2340 length:1986 start_codon:yes stop_codon:yes gene_type:complete
MKIPQYRRQTALTPDSGARPLSVTASPSAYAAPANAAFQLGAQMVKGGQQLGDIAVTELKQENATLQAAEENKFSDFLFQAQTDVLTAPVGQSQTITTPQNTANGIVFNEVQLPAETQQAHMARVRSLLSERITKQAAKIPDRDVARRFKTAAAAKMRAALPGLNTTLRTRYLDRYKAEMNRSDETERRRIGTLTGATRIAAMQAHVAKIRDNGLEQGESLVDIEKRERGFLSSLDEDLVKQSMITIESMRRDEKENAYENLKVQLLDAKNFPHLDNDTRNRLIATVSGEEESAERAQTNYLNTQDARNETKRREAQLTLFEKLQAQTLAARQHAITGEGPPVENITAFDISQLRELNKDQRNSLRAMMRGEDAIYNPKLYRDYVNQINEATTDSDLDEINADIHEDTARLKLGGKAASELRNQINGLKAKTPEALERKRYRNNLKQALGAFSTRYGRADEPLREAQVLDFYDSQLQKDVRPGVAYINALARAKAETNEKATALIQGLPQNLYEQFEKYFQNNKIILPGKGEDADDKVAAKQALEQNLVFIEKSRNTMLKYLRDQIEGFERKYDFEIDGVERADGVEFQERMDGGAVSQQELGERQRVKDPDKRLTQKDRLSIRQLFTLEKRIELIVSTLETHAKTLGENSAEPPNEGRGN